MQIKTIGILGAGVMGYGIAQVCAQNGFDVILRDVSDEIVQKGLNIIEWYLNRQVIKDKITDDDRAAALSRIKTTSDMSAMKDSDYVIEAVFEIVAKNPPSIAMAGGVLLMLTGNNDTGMTVFSVGAVLQGIWLALRFGLLER